MPNYTMLHEGPRPQLIHFIVVDRSASLGEYLQQINMTLPQFVDAIRKRYHGRANVRIALLTFESACRWVTENGPEDLEDFVCPTLTEGSLTRLGAALTELDAKCSKSEFLRFTTSNLMPGFTFITDGHPTDDWQEPLARLQDNTWFARGSKIGFAIGDKPNVDLIAQIVGNREAVITPERIEDFSDLLLETLVTSTLINGSTHTAPASGAEVAAAALEASHGQARTSVLPQGTPEPAPEPEPDLDDAWTDESNWN